VRRKTPVFRVLRHRRRQAARSLMDGSADAACIIALLTLLMAGFDQAGI
jgi:hypothetical protein